ncbi:MAG: HU family DNA-binding protein [Massilibacteroides sp.]|nr:HU family DNA-binding protein [Massilibacteroides sp.]
MNKTEVVNAVALQTGLKKVEAKNAVEAFVNTITDALKEGDKVALLGFGTFSIVEKAERPGINPRTKEAITIAARKVIKFKAGSELSEKVK